MKILIKASSGMAYKRRGTFLDSSDGKWTICTGTYGKSNNKKFYYLLNKDTNEYVKDTDGELRTWMCLQDCKTYIEKWV